MIALVPILLVIITFLFWYQTWFGRQLSDKDLSTYLADTSVPHKTQHAVVQLVGRMTRNDPQARRWYPQLIRLASRPEPGFRTMAAWAMGQDNRAEEFHRELLKLLADKEPMVRRNAALSLVRFGDASGRSELRALLEPFPLSSPAAGKVKYRFREDDPVRNGIAVARVETAGGGTVDIATPVAGRLRQRAVSEGMQVDAGVLVAVISPGEDQVWEALRALYLIGTADELGVVDRFAGGVEGFPESIRQQASSTAEAIRKRAVQK